MTNKKDFFLETGQVIKPLGNSAFRVKCKNGQEIIATIKKNEFHRNTRGKSKKILGGEWVLLEISTNDLTKGDIVGFAKDPKIKSE